MPHVKPAVLRPALLLLAVFLLPATGWAENLRCGGSLVMRGDFAVEVLDKCGEPDFVDNWQQTAVGPGGVIPNVEQWYYNFGPTQLVQVLEFREGRLRRVDSADYGFNTPGPRDCRPAEVVQGVSKYRLLEMCGEPAQVDSLIVLANPNGYTTSPLYRPNTLVPVLREFWVYNFGSRHLLREVTLENGIVVEVDTQGRGFGNR